MGEPLSECSTGSPPATPSRKWAWRNSTEACSPVCAVWTSQPTTLRLNPSLDQAEVEKHPGHRADQVGDVPTPPWVGSVGNPGGRPAAARRQGQSRDGPTGRLRAGCGRSWTPRPGTRLGPPTGGRSGSAAGWQARRHWRLPRCAGVPPGSACSRASAPAPPPAARPVSLRQVPASVAGSGG